MVEAGRLEAAQEVLPTYFIYIIFLFLNFYLFFESSPCTGIRDSCVLIEEFVVVLSS